jgi:hypothetical protein
MPAVGGKEIGNQYGNKGYYQVEIIKLQGMRSDARPITLKGFVEKESNAEDYNESQGPFCRIACSNHVFPQFT